MGVSRLRRCLRIRFSSPSMEGGIYTLATAVTAATEGGCHNAESRPLPEASPRTRSTVAQPPLRTSLTQRASRSTLWETCFSLRTSRTASGESTRPRGQSRRLSAPACLAFPQTALRRPARSLNGPQASLSIPRSTFTSQNPATFSFVRLMDRGCLPLSPVRALPASQAMAARPRKRSSTRSETSLWTLRETFGSPTASITESVS